jgi:hypothetical protein
MTLRTSGIENSNPKRYAFVPVAKHSITGNNAIVVNTTVFTIK